MREEFFVGLLNMSFTGGIVTVSLRLRLERLKRQEIRFRKVNGLWISGMSMWEEKNRLTAM